MGLVRSKQPATPAADRRARGRTVDDLIEALDDADPDARRRSALDLAHQPGAVDALVVHIGTEHDTAARDAMLSALATDGTAAAAFALAPYLRSDDAVLRNAVTQALGEMPGAVEVLPSLLADSDPAIRLVAVMVLGMLRSPLVPGWLVDLVVSDGDARVCAAAVDLLAEVGDAAAVPAMIAGVARFPDDPYLAFALGVATARLGGGAT